MSILDRALRLGEGKQFRQYAKRVDQINAWEPELELLDDDELREQFADACASAPRSGESLDDLLPETFALVREVGRRTHEHAPLRRADDRRHGPARRRDRRDAHRRGQDADRARSPSSLNALRGEGVHVVTVNDYLARRDADWMRPDLRGPRPHRSACCRTCSPTRRSAPPTRPTSRTARTPSSASTTCATTWPRRWRRRSSTAAASARTAARSRCTTSRSSTRSTTSSSTRRARR